MKWIPSIEEHCRISLHRTRGLNDFRRLHEWIDEPRKQLGSNHRLFRHTDNIVDRYYIEKRWGKKGVIEWLFHIAIDNLVTSYRSSHKVYCNTYNFYTIGLVDHGEIVLNCHKLSNVDIIRKFQYSTF